MSGVPQLANTEYVTKNGEHCPYCQGKHLWRQSIEPDDAGRATQDMTCMDCGSTWTNHYSLFGYSPR